MVLAAALASPDRRLIRAALALSLGLAVLAGVLMLIPNAGSRPLFPLADKLAHALAFLAICLPVATVVPQRTGWIAAVALTYGALIEVIQPSFGRSAELWDLVADAVGIALAIALGRWLHPRLTARRRSP